VTLLETEDLGYELDERTLLDGVSARCEPGELNVLFGESGSGKSTFVRLLAGFETANRGTITLDGKPISEVEPRDWRRRVVMLLQQARVFPGTVEDNVTYGARYHDLPVNAGELLERCQLEIDPDRPAHTLSGGERQRMVLARALAVDPDYLLLDEPTSSLHDEARRAINSLVVDVTEQRGIGAFVVTHNPRDVEQFGTHGYHLKDGQLETLVRDHLNRVEA
jgi:putative ABC transport system ATP-binding protein